MSISFGGLSSGIDTNAIIDQLLAIARQPADRLKTQKTELSNKMDALSGFNSKLQTLLSKVDALDTSSTLLSNAVTASSADYLKATAGSGAIQGNYDVKVGQLAQVEKSVFEGVADRDTTTFGTGTISIASDNLASPVSITIDDNHNTLEGIRDAINDQSETLGLKASIINDGSGSPYRLVLTGSTVADANIVLDAGGLSGGTGTFPVKDDAVSRTAQQAMIQVDGVTIVGDTNTFTEAIPGLTLDLTHADAGFDAGSPDWSSLTTTTLSVSTDAEGIKSKITDFMNAFNDVVKAAGDDSLASDSGVRAIMSALRGKFTSSVGGTGLFQLGMQTQKDGTLSLDSSKLSDAIQDDLDGVELLLAGNNDTDGIADLLKSSLSSFTNTTTGFLAGRQTSYDNSVRRIDTEITRNEYRVSEMEKQLVAKFSALETLVNSLNSQGNYLTQQMNVNNS